MKEILLIAGMVVVTFGVRYPVLALVGRIELPESVRRALRYVPLAVLTAITVPAMLYAGGEKPLIAAGNAHLAAGLISVLVAWRSRNLLLTIAVGMGAFLGWRLLFGGF